MRKVLIFIGLLLLTCGVATAACSRVEGAFGYQYVRVNSGIAVTTQPGSSAGPPTSTKTNLNLNGWNAEVAVNPTCLVGIVADFSGVYGSPTFSGTTVTTHVYNFLFGPRINLRNPSPVTPFVEGLFGGSHASATVSGITVSDNAFAAAFGGGVDIGISAHVAIRGRADYLMTRFGSNTQNNAAVSAGLVFRL